MGKSARVIAMKLPLDLGFAGPLYVSAVLCYTSLVRTGDPSSCYPFWREVFPKAYAAGVSMHAVFQSINFRFIPNRQRILYDNMTSLLWKTALSFLSNQKSDTDTEADADAAAAAVATIADADAAEAAGAEGEGEGEDVPQECENIIVRS
eukprot:COSAG06_NODE_2245_length_7263_cov_19.964964_6_plen_150_part_00